MKPSRIAAALVLLSLAGIAFAFQPTAHHLNSSPNAQRVVSPQAAGGFVQEPPTYPNYGFTISVTVTGTPFSGTYPGYEEPSGGPVDMSTAPATRLDRRWRVVLRDAASNNPRCVIGIRSTQFPNAAAPVSWTGSIVGDGSVGNYPQNSISLTGGASPSGTAPWSGGGNVTLTVN